MKKAKEMVEQSISYPAAAHLQKARQRLTGLLIVVLSLLAVLFELPAQAQSIMTIKPFQVRVELPTGFSSTFYLTNCNLRIPTNGASGVDGTGTNWVIASVNVSVSGAPAGCTASLVNSDLVTPVGTIPVNMNTGNTAQNTNLIVKLTCNGSESSGVANLAITATGAGLPDDIFELPVEIAKIWNGPANATTGAGHWSDGAQWLGTGAPGPNDHVVFTDLGTQTNSVVTTATTTNLLTSALIDTTTTISSLRFSQTNGNGSIKTNWHNLYINPNMTLAIAGDDGFSMLRDYTYWNAGLMKVSIYGTNASFVQTNENANFSILSDGQQASVLDMSGLSNLRLDVNQLDLSDFAGYPNYYFLAYTNNYSNTSPGTGKPQRFYQVWDMAQTNLIKATYVDPYNYTNAESRSYALELGRNEASGGGSGKDVEIFMGNSNVFNLDSICVAGSFCLGADFQFLNSGSYAIFRNADGVSRMSIFATADAGGPTLAAGLGDNTKCGGNGLGVDFTKGMVDMLVDKLYLSLDRSNVTVSGKGVSQTSGLFVSSGIIDANDAIFGYQGSGTHTNQCYCYAQVTVSNTAVLKINKNLALGYTTSTDPATDSANLGYGRLTIGPGGTVFANNISVGGVTKLSSQNTITMNNGASLVVSNSIGDATPGGALGTLSLNGNCSLTLFVNGTNPPAPFVYLTNLTASGTGNKLIIGGVQNVTNYPADIPLIAGVGPAISPTVFDAGVAMPDGSGLTGILTLSSSNTINLRIINRSPNTLLWRGPGSTANWDHTAKNWLDVNTGIMTNYDDPDIVSFDDTPGYATNINITGVTALTPGAVNMTNNTLRYTFLDGGNLIIGSPAFNKYGTGTVEVDANTSLSVQLAEGALTGSAPGAIGGVSVAAGAVLNFGGAIGGGVICSGTATTGGGVSGTLTVLPGGVVTNSGTVANPFAVQTNGFLYNSGAGTLNNIGTGSSGSPQVAAGGILINSGAINGDLLYVNGAFEDLGTSGMTLTSLTLGAGGTFIPGGDGIGNTTINSDGVGNFPGAALLTQGSTTVFKINAGAPANTVLTADHLSFGGSSSQQTQNGCTLMITNISATPFSAGQTFQLFANLFSPSTAPFSTGSSTNTYPVIVPQTPGPGLAWDLRHLWAPDNSSHSGYIGVISGSGGATLTNSFTVGTTNVVGQFSWDQSAYGMRLETLVTPPTVGVNGTNWTSVPGSWTNTTMTITNTLSTNNVFFRLAFP